MKVAVTVDEIWFKLVLAPGIKPTLKAYFGAALSHDPMSFLDVPVEVTCSGDVTRCGDMGRRAKDLREEVRDAIMHDVLMELRHKVGPQSLY